MSLPQSCQSDRCREYAMRCRRQLRRYLKELTSQKETWDRRDGDSKLDCLYVYACTSLRTQQRGASVDCGVGGTHCAALGAACRATNRLTRAHKCAQHRGGCYRIHGCDRGCFEHCEIAFAVVGVRLVMSGQRAPAAFRVMSRGRDFVCMFGRLFPFA